MKVSMKNWRQNRMKQFWLHTLLRTYSSVMIIIIASFAILLSYADWDSREKEAQRVAQRVTTRNSRRGGILLSRVSPASTRFSS